MTENELKSLGEFGLIKWLRQQVGSAEHLLKGIGDDCAIQRQRAGWQLLTSTDLLIEDVHFMRQWTSMEALGGKAAAVNISDIAAMGGLPKSLYLGVAVPDKVPLADLEAFCLGFIAEAERYGAVLAGGDTCGSAGPMMISVTVQGEVETGKAVCRDSARPGEALYVSGTLGDSALALRMLQRGEQPAAALLRSHHQPQARVKLGRQLATPQLASAMLDLSDGLLADLGHILDASGCGAEIRLPALPLSEEFRAAMAAEPELLDLALAGGEDYELLFTSTREDLQQQEDLQPAVTKIGQLTVEPGVRIRQADDSLYQCPRGGFDHFSR